ncbi:MAG: enoyl-CoA hydratase-related protein [Alphaproteobacteria bacterium]
MNDVLLTDIDARGVATITLNRPDVHNAFNDDLIAALHDAVRTLGSNPSVRVVLLTGAGKSFSAGADLDWMRKAAGYTEAENRADAIRLSEMLHELDTLPKPTVALVNGAALAGGAGLVACCDFAISVSSARFGFTEVRLGLTPATISPYVVATIGARNARRLFLTAKRFDAATALDIRLLSQVVDDTGALEAAGEVLVNDLLAGAPGAHSATKNLLAAVASQPLTRALREDTARRIAERRATDEGKEGIASFFERRKPNWVEGG